MITARLWKASSIHSLILPSNKTPWVYNVNPQSLVRMNVLSSPFQRVCIASSKSRPLFQKFPIYHNKGLKTTHNNINNNHINLRFFSNSTSSTTVPSPTSLAYFRSFAYQKNGNRGSWNWSSWTRGRTGWKGASVVSTIGLGGIAVSLATYSRPAVLCEGSHLPSPTRTTV